MNKQYLSEIFYPFDMKPGYAKGVAAPPNAMANKIPAIPQPKHPQKWKFNIRHEEPLDELTSMLQQEHLGKEFAKAQQEAFGLGQQDILNTLPTVSSMVQTQQKHVVKTLEEQHKIDMVQLAQLGITEMSKQKEFFESFGTTGTRLEAIDNSTLNKITARTVDDLADRIMGAYETELEKIFGKIPDTKLKTQVITQINNML